MVEGARLESVYRGNSIEGSNPSLSASNLQTRTCRILANPLFETTLGTKFAPFSKTGTNLGAGVSFLATNRAFLVQFLHLGSGEFPLTLLWLSGLSLRMAGGSVLDHLVQGIVGGPHGRRERP